MRSRAGGKLEKARKRQNELEARQAGMSASEIERAAKDVQELVDDSNLLTAQAERMEAEELGCSVEELRASLLAPIDSGPLPEFDKGNYTPATRRHVSGNRLGRARSYSSVFHESGEPLSDGGFRSFGDYLQAVGTGGRDPRLNDLLPQSAQSAGVGQFGGFLVPSQFAAEMLDSSLEDEIIRPRADVRPVVGTDTLRISGWNNQDNSTGAPFGGMAMEWLGEDEAATVQVGKFRC
ncbi:MAG: phage major capsid protein [Planctomycetota bacterium]